MIKCIIWRPYSVFFFFSNLCAKIVKKLISGDNDALLTLVLIPRMMWKCEIFQSQIRDKFPGVDLDNKGELVKGDTANQYASRCRLSYHIRLLTVRVLG